MYATKVATSGEGGAISTDDEALGETLRLIRNHGMVHGSDTRHLGFNYRMPEVAAAIASVQMDRLSGFLRARVRNVAFLEERIGSVRGSEFLQRNPDRTHAYYLYTLYLSKHRNSMVSALNHAGVGAAVYFRTPVHKTPLYRGLGYGRKPLRSTEAASRHVISLPVHPGLGLNEMERVADAFVAAARDNL